MAEFSIKGITNAGTTIFGNADTAHKIVFVKALSSTSDVSLSDILQMNEVDQSDWDGPNGVVVSDLTNVVNDVARITVRFPAQSQEYRVKTVAVTAQLANVTSPVETIVSVQSDPNKILFIPSTSSVQDSVYVRFNITINNNNNPTAVVTPGLYASIGDYNNLNERAVTTHSKEDASVGDDQSILGEKHFNNNVIFSEGILVKDQDVADIRVQTKAQSIVPQSTLAYNLGDTNLKWSDVYATNFNGTATDAINLSYKSGSTVTPKLTANNTQVTAKTSIVPDANDAYYLGSGQRRWNTLFCECIGDANWPIKWMYLSAGNDVDCGIELVKSVEYSDESTIRPITNNCSTLGDSSHRYYQVWTTDCDIINLYTENTEVDNITVWNMIDVVGTASIVGAADFYGGIYSDGSISCDGDLSVGGTVTSNDVIPDSNNTHCLGSTSYRWKNVYVAGSSGYYLEIGNCTSVDDNNNIETSEPVIRPSSSGWGFLGTPKCHFFKAYIDNLYIGSSNTALSSYIAGTTVTNATNATNTSNVYVTVADSNASYPLVFRTSYSGSGSLSSGNKGLYCDKDNKITYNPYTNTLTCTTFSGDLSGNATSATKATQDGSGNNIKSNYAASLVKNGSVLIGSYNSNTALVLKNKSDSTLSTVYLSDIIANALTGIGGYGTTSTNSFGSIGTIGLFAKVDVNTPNASYYGQEVAGSNLCTCSFSTTNTVNYSGNSVTLALSSFNIYSSDTRQSGTWKLLSTAAASSTSWSNTYISIVLAVRVF